MTNCGQKSVPFPKVAKFVSDVSDRFEAYVVEIDSSKASKGAQLLP